MDRRWCLVGSYFIKSPSVGIGLAPIRLSQSRTSARNVPTPICLSQLYGNRKGHSVGPVPILCRHYGHLQGMSLQPSLKRGLQHRLPQPRRADQRTLHRGLDLPCHGQPPLDLCHDATLFFQRRQGNGHLANLSLID